MMNEVLAALEHEQENISIQRIEVVSVRPGDTILVYFKNRKATEKSIQIVRDNITRIFPQCGIIAFIDDDIRFVVAREQG